jgi:5-methylcytosine-specific restriction endonuclease McrA
MTEPLTGWAKSKRPKNPQWNAIRNLIGERDQWRCQEFTDNNIPCTYPGTECDHIIPTSQGGGDNVDNLRMLCRWHHRKKTELEARAGRVYVTTKRPTPKHPGMI